MSEEHTYSSRRRPNANRRYNFDIVIGAALLSTYVQNIVGGVKTAARLKHWRKHGNNGRENMAFGGWDTGINRQPGHRPKLC